MEGINKMSVGEHLDKQIQIEYVDFCKTKCHIRVAKHNAIRNHSEVELSELQFKHCFNCVAKEFIENGLGVTL